MAQFKAFDPNVEVSGGHLAAFVQAFPAGTEEIGMKMLNAAGLGNPDPNKWYKLQALLDVMKDLQESFNPGLLTRMGYQVAQVVQVPPDWDDIDVTLLGLDKGYQMNHRGGRIGSYSCEDLGTENGLRRMKMTVKTHWPCEYELGIIQGASERFKRNGAEVNVRKDEAAPCRKNGGESCTFLVSWG
jgi:hypothetical protein